MGSVQRIYFGVGPRQPVLCGLPRLDGAPVRSASGRSTRARRTHARGEGWRGGLGVGALAIATAVSDFAYAADPKREWRAFVVRKQAKDHGLGKLIEGAIRSGDRALIVDDVLTSGGSLLKAVVSGREGGGCGAHTLVIVDRREKEGREKVEQEGVKVISLLTIDDLTAA